jgi:plasmid stabilization system protein ParE
MSYSLKILPDARSDMREAIDWYNSQKKGLGTKFFKHLAEAMKLVLENPHLFQIRYKEVRQANIKTFPFQVHFFIDEERHDVVVIAVLHTSRNPQIWKDRK